MIKNFHQPRPGEKVWDERRHLNGQQPNGKVDHVLVWGEDGEILVQWHSDSWHPDPEYETFGATEMSEAYSGQKFGFMFFADGRFVPRTS